MTTQNTLKTFVYYVALRNGNPESSLRASSIEALQKLIAEKFTYKLNMLPENVIYWEDYRKSLTIAKETTTYESI